MAFRGRGRGRGHGRGALYDTRIAHHVPYDDFPEHVSLPDAPDIRIIPNEAKVLIASKVRLENFWKHSSYYLEEAAPKTKSQHAEIERFSDRFKTKKQSKRESLADYLKLTPSNFPPELIHGSRRVQHDSKRLRWDQDSDEQLFDVFAKLEESYKGRDENVGQEKKGDSEEEEDAEKEVEQESTDDDDYNQNIDFDDDEDDWNMEEEEHEDTYE
ncbi:DNA-directed RNA polymerase III subunit RPC7-like [Cocos nucifera]|nr:DNA-directed RNA polymerase III subunit RPC7-like [Cocos nucifera]